MGIRGTLPGLLHPVQDLGNAFATGAIVDGAGDLAGRRFDGHPHGVTGQAARWARCLLMRHPVQSQRTVFIPEPALLLRGNRVDESVFGALITLQGAAWVAGADPFGGDALDPTVGVATIPGNVRSAVNNTEWTLGPGLRRGNRRP